jgi:curved DNA-binding protein CbpA
MADHYKTLGVKRSATQGEIKDQYRLLSKQYHPDKLGGDEKKFKEIASAYEVLGDWERRKSYHETGSDTTEADFDRKAGGLLQQLFQLIVSQKGLVEMQKMDVIKAVNDQIDSGMDKLDDNIDVARRSRKEIGNIVKRVKHKNKMNPIRLMLIQEIQKHTETIMTSKEGKEVGKRARAMWKEYGFDHDQEQMKVNYRLGYGNVMANLQTVTFTGTC